MQGLIEYPPLMVMAILAGSVALGVMFSVILVYGMCFLAMFYFGKKEEEKIYDSRGIEPNE